MLGEDIAEHNSTPHLFGWLVALYGQLGCARCLRSNQPFFFSMYDDEEAIKPELDDEAKLKAALIKEQLEQFEFKEKVRTYLLQYYTTASTPKEASFHFTTAEIWEQLQQLFPSVHYSATDVATWMNTGGFRFYDFGQMKFEWLINKM